MQTLFCMESLPRERMSGHRGIGFLVALAFASLLAVSGINPGWIHSPGVGHGSRNALDAARLDMPGLSSTSSIKPGPSQQGSVQPMTKASSPVPQWVSGTSVGPSARSGAVMTYDARDGYVLLFGGWNDQFSGVYGDTWKYSSGTWTQIPIGGVLCGGPSQPSCAGSAPSPRFYSSMAYDPRDDEVVLFGGIDSGDNPLGDTWVYMSGTWSTPTPGTAPLMRGWAAMTFDYADNYILLWGGVSPGHSCYAGGADCDDTWSYAGGTWTLLSPSTSPPPQGEGTPGISFDSRDGRVILLSYSGGTWGFSGGNWVETTATNPPLGNEPALAYDQWDNEVLTLAQYPTTWSYSSGTWTNITKSESTQPSNRLEYSFANDSADGYLLLFGGRPWGLSGQLGDTWELVPPSRPHNSVWWVGAPANHTYHGILPYTLNVSLETNVSSGSQVVCPKGSYNFEFIYYPYAGSPNNDVCTNANSSYYAFTYTNLTPAIDTYAAWENYPGAIEAPNLAVYLDTRMHVSVTLSANGTTPGTQVTIGATTGGGVDPKNDSIVWTLNGSVSGWSNPGNVSSFPYTPTGAGNYTFSVSVGDRWGQVVTNKTILAVVPQSPPKPLTANVTLSAYRVQNGTPVTATAHLGNATSPSYSWTLNGSIPLSCSGSTCLVTLNHAAKYEVNLTVTDGSRVAWSQAPLTVYYSSGPPPPLLGSISLSANDSYPGTPVWVNVSASGGQVPYTYAWTLNGSAQAWTQSSLQYVPHGAGNYTFAVNVSDLAGQSIVRTTVLTVLRNGTSPPPPLVVGVALSNNGTHPGTEVWVNATASGGWGAITYSWTENGTTFPGSGSSVAFVPKGAGNYSFVVTVADPAGQRATKGAVLTVLPNSIALPLTVSLSANVSQIHAGDMVSLTGSATGGWTPYAYTWSLNGTNDTSLGTSASLSLTIPHAGNYTYQLWVTDAKGSVASSSPVTVQVLPLTPGGSKGHGNGSAIGIPWWVLIVVLALVVALLLLLLFVARRRHNSKAAEAPPPRLVSGPQPIPPAPPADYLAGVSLSQNEWDESVEPDSAYGTYTLGPEEHTEFRETVQKPLAEPAPTATTAARPAPRLEEGAYRPWSMKITPEGIQMEEIPRSSPGPRVVDAEFATIPEAKKKAPDDATKPSGPSSDDVYAVMQSIARKPRSLDGIKQDVRLDDDTLFTVLGALSKAKLIVRGTRKGSEATIFVLTPLGRKVARRFIPSQEERQDAGELEGEKPAALPAGKPPKTSSVRVSKDTTLQDVHSLGEERGSLEEETPFHTLRPEDVNPQLKGKAPLPKSVLQPMEMRVQADRGADTRDTTETTDADKRAQILMERAQKEREEKGKQGKFGFMRAKKPTEEDKDK